jgi:hypothetical protein
MGDPQLFNTFTGQVELGLNGAKVANEYRQFGSNFDRSDYDFAIVRHKVLAKCKGAAGLKTKCYPNWTATSCKVSKAASENRIDGPE